MNLKIDRVRYRRNGVDGAGFFAVQFREREGRRFVPRIGVLFGNISEEPETRVAECAVIDPADILNTRRGDNYESTLRAACIAADADGSAYQQ